MEKNSPQESEPEIDVLDDSEESSVAASNTGSKLAESLSWSSSEQSLGISPKTISFQYNQNNITSANSREENFQFRNAHLDRSEMIEMERAAISLCYLKGSRFVRNLFSNASCPDTSSLKNAGGSFGPNTFLPPMKISTASSSLKPVWSSVSCPFASNLEKLSVGGESYSTSANLPSSTSSESTTASSSSKKVPLSISYPASAANVKKLFSGGGSFMSTVDLPTSPGLKSTSASSLLNQIHSIASFTVPANVKTRPAGSTSFSSSLDPLTSPSSKSTSASCSFDQNRLSVNLPTTSSESSVINDSFNQTEPSANFPGVDSKRIVSAGESSFLFGHTTTTSLQSTVASSSINQSRLSVKHPTTSISENSVVDDSLNTIEPISSFPGVGSTTIVSAEGRSFPFSHPSSRSTAASNVFNRVRLRAIRPSPSELKHETVPACSSSSDQQVVRMGSVRESTGGVRLWKDRVSDEVIPDGMWELTNRVRFRNDRESGVVVQYESLPQLQDVDKVMALVSAEMAVGSITDLLSDFNDHCVHLSQVREAMHHLETTSEGKLAKYLHGFGDYEMIDIHPYDRLIDHLQVSRDIGQQLDEDHSKLLEMFRDLELERSQLEKLLKTVSSSQMSFTLATKVHDAIRVLEAKRACCKDMLKLSKSRKNFFYFVRDKTMYLFEKL